MRLQTKADASSNNFKEVILVFLLCDAINLLLISENVLL